LIHVHQSLASLTFNGGNKMIELNVMKGNEPNCPECEKTGAGGNAMLWDSKAEPSWTYTPEGDNREPLKCRDCGFQVGAGKYILKAI